MTDRILNIASFLEGRVSNMHGYYGNYVCDRCHAAGDQHTLLTYTYVCRVWYDITDKNDLII